MAQRELSTREISDRLQIQALLVRYTKAIDDKDFDLLDQVFTPDAHIDYASSGGPAGRFPEVKDWLKRALAPFSVSQHLISNTTLELDGDRARSRTMFWNPMGTPKANGELHIFYVGGWYRDELIWTPDGWRICVRVEEQAFRDGSLPEGFVIPE